MYVWGCWGEEGWKLKLKRRSLTNRLTFIPQMCLEFGWRLISIIPCTSGTDPTLLRIWDESRLKLQLNPQANLIWNLYPCMPLFIHRSTALSELLLALLIEMGPPIRVRQVYCWKMSPCRNKLTIPSNSNKAAGTSTTIAKTRTRTFTGVWLLETATDNLGIIRWRNLHQTWTYMEAKVLNNKEVQTEFLEGAIIAKKQSQFSSSQSKLVCKKEHRKMKRRTRWLWWNFRLELKYSKLEHKSPGEDEYTDKEDKKKKKV